METDAFNILISTIGLGQLDQQEMTGVG